MGGGPPTIDMWDLKPGAPTGGQFKPIATTGDVQICEQMPTVAKQMKHLSIVRSMSTREADHDRGRYYMHTGYVPNPSVEHPSYGAVVAHELEEQGAASWRFRRSCRSAGRAKGPGFLGMAYAPFQVDANGQVRDAEMSVPWQRMDDRMKLLGGAGDAVHRRAPRHGGRGARQGAREDAGAADQRADGGVQGPQRAEGNAREVRRQQLRPRLPDGPAAGRSRRAVRRSELGRLGLAPELLHDARNEAAGAGQGVQRRWSKTSSSAGCLESTVVLWMGEFGRTPRINGDAGRDHLARAWSVVLGGAAIKGGRAIGKTNADGTSVESESVLVGRPDGDGLPGAGHLAGNDVHGQERPADEDRQRRQGDSRAVRVIAAATARAGVSAIACSVPATMSP